MRSLLRRLADVGARASGRPLTAASESEAGADGTDAPDADRRARAAWLIRHDLAPLGFAAFRERDPETASLLARDALGGAAANLAHFEALARIERSLAASGVPVTLLKGASVAAWAYADPSYRPMTDLDLWIPDAEMERAKSLMRELGYRQDPGLAERPEPLQQRSGGEILFRPEGGAHGLVELHFSPFQGWWIQRTACPDLEGMRERSVPAAPGRHARRLSTEDALLQAAFHLVVNQFGQAPFRGLMDLAVIARAVAVDWELVAHRARSWRIATATWVALDAAERLIGLPGARPALRRLRPGMARRTVLHAFVSPSSLLASRDLTRPVRRHPFMLAIADRRRDGARLVGRTLWPERWWLAARHGRAVGRIEHLWGLVRRGEV